MSKVSADAMTAQISPHFQTSKRCHAVLSLKQILSRLLDNSCSCALVGHGGCAVNEPHFQNSFFFFLISAAFPFLYACVYFGEFSHLEISMQVRLEGTGLTSSCRSSVGRNQNTLTYSKDARGLLQEQVDGKWRGEFGGGGVEGDKLEVDDRGRQ